MTIFYDIVIRLYRLGIGLVSPFNSKAQQWIIGRKNWHDQLINIPSDRQIAWVHCASTGEYEQGKPIIKLLKENNPDIYIVLSFFSPSGYKSYIKSDWVDKICYLPLDTKKNATSFIQVINPSIAIFIKYEIWYHYLDQLQLNNIPTFLVSARFYKGHYVLKYGFAFILNKLKSLEKIFVQDKTSYNLLKSKGFDNILISGDTRIDQVIQNKNYSYKSELLRNTINNRTCIVAGSTWPKDDDLITTLKDHGSELFLIIAPHEYDAQKIKDLVQKFGPGAITYSELSTINSDMIHTIILDQMGILKYIYRYADLAYIGGGFDQGIHNILEAIVYEIPVLFGPNHFGFVEAKDLLKLEVASVVSNQDELLQNINRYTANDSKEVLEQAIDDYIHGKSGGSSKILNHIHLSS